MLIVDLPPEILTDIARHVQTELDPDHILALALSCHCIHAAVKHLIASRISVIYASRRFELLRQKLFGEDRTYGNQTRYLAFTENYGSYRESGFFQPACRGEQGILKRFLGSFPRLRSLHIHYTVPNSEFVDALFSKCFVARDTLRSLSIQIPKCTLNPERLSELLLLPRLERFSLSAEMYECPPDPNKLDRKSNVHYLDLASPRYVNQWQFSYSQFTQLVTVLPHLQHLSINVPAEHEDALEKSRKGRAAFYSFNAARLNEALAPLSRTLTNLTLRTTAQQYQEHSGQYLDLSGFSVLQELTASAWCFFAPRRQGLAVPLHRLLPISLERLQIEFPLEVCIFRDTHHLAGEHILPDPLAPNSSWSRDLKYDKVWPSIYPLKSEEYLWLMEFAHHKPRFLPNLTEMVLSEDEWYHQYFVVYFAYPFFTERLVLPPLLDSAMQDVGVDCTVYIRTGRIGNYSATPWGSITPAPPSW